MTNTGRWLICLLFLLTSTTTVHADRRVSQLEKSLKPLTDLLEARNFSAAEEWCEKVRSSLRSHGYKQLADYLLFWEHPHKAAEFYEKSGYRRGFNRLGKYYVRNDDMENARISFAKGIASRERSRFYFQEGVAKRAAGNLLAARADYQLALEDLITLIGSLDFIFSTEDAALRRNIQDTLELLPSTPKEKREQKKLRQILRRAALYCSRLHQQVFHFICTEEISETVNRGWELQVNPGNLRFGLRSKRPQRYLNQTFLYDYQLIEDPKSGHHVESRTLLKENGIRRNRPNAPNKCIFRIFQPIFSPIEFLSPEWQTQYWFRIIRETRWEGRPVVVIQAVPYDPDNQRTVSGHIWIDKEDFSIIRIRMSPKSIRNYNLVRREAAHRGLTPELVFEIQFLQRKSGFRFPTSCTLKESYHAPGRSPFVRVHSQYNYSNYKFFQVNSRSSAPTPSEPPI